MGISLGANTEEWYTVLPTAGVDSSGDSAILRTL